MRQIRKFGALVLLALSMTSWEAAGATWCGGTVKAVLTDGSGRVYVLPTFRNDWIQVCNLTAVWKGVSSEVCKSWSATLTALRLTQEPVVMHYSEDFACGSIPSYDSAYAPAYVSITVN